MIAAVNVLMAPLSAYSATAAGALISAVWQGALLVVLVALVLRAFPALSAAARSFVWLSVFVLLALLHLAPLVGAHAVATAAEPKFQLDPRWSLAIGGLWLMLSLARTGQLLWGALHVCNLGRRAVPVEVDPTLLPLLQHGSRTVQLCTSDEVARPSVLGFFRPRILVPPALLEALSLDELKHVVLHEMEHLHRHDDWCNLLQKLALVLFPLNPALLWVERRLCAERELACDDRVLQAGSGRKAYALCLTHLAEYSLLRRGYALMLGAWERRPELVRRVHRILSHPGSVMGRKPAMAVTGTVMAAALGGAVTLAHAPQLVSFTPSTTATAAVDQTDMPDTAAWARSLGGTPMRVRATMPAAHRSAPVYAPKPVRAVAKKRARISPPQTRLAELKTPPPADVQALLVMAEWNEMEAPRVIFAVTHVSNAQQQPVAIPAMYIVPTPDGWLVVKI